MSMIDPFLQKLFTTMSEQEIHNEPFIRKLNELANEFADADIAAMSAFSNYKDTLSYLHEKFLAQYNPQLRELRGVYYTPDPVVSYIIRSIDFILHSHFDHQNGLTDISEDMMLLDPACGTGIFLQAVIQHIRREFQKTGDHQSWQAYVHSKILPRLFGFELLKVPYAIAHLKLTMQLAALDLPEAERQEWAYHFKNHENLNIYLTNTLEQVEETMKSGKIMVILGNPPFAGHSTNKGQWITTLINSYKEDCPELEKPGQAKWLSDDYVKFMRFAQWHIEQAGYGILAFITNHSYLDNPTFRGMRRSLLRNFDDIYILDLHGNRKKQEQAPDGSKDENVFDIQQGVAINIFVKWREYEGFEGGGQPRSYISTCESPVSGEHSAAFAKVHHADVWGLREVYQFDTQGKAVLTGGKYAWLAQHDLASTRWTILNPQAPFYLFSPQESRYLTEYKAGWSVVDIFRPNGDPAAGVVTCHDQFAISWTKDEAYAKIERFLATETEEEARQLFRLCSQNQWRYSVAKSQLQQNTWHQDITQILYRPFDRRWTTFNRYVTVHRRLRVMRHMLDGTNIGLTIGRAGQVIDQVEWDIAFCTRYITEFNLFRRGGNTLFPLYLYDNAVPTQRKANLALNFVADCAEQFGMKWIAIGRGDLQHTFGPEDILSYMYALFYSPTYRKRYAPFLKIDFPRLPLTSNRDLFRGLCVLGNRLVSLHLMEQYLPSISAFAVPGINRVEEVRYITQGQDKDAGQVWINATQYFDCVPTEAWTFSIGGYQMCKKWLKDRIGHKLAVDELAHYQQIVAILAETCQLMRKIDAVIEKNGGWPM